MSVLLIHLQTTGGIAERGMSKSALLCKWFVGDRLLCAVPPW
jgi:hypothetical protein